jgi:amino acid adenylation domain-containing protein
MKTIDHQKDAQRKVAEDHWISQLKGVDYRPISSYCIPSNSSQAFELELDSECQEKFEKASGGQAHNRFVLIGTALSVVKSIYAGSQDVLLSSSGFTLSNEVPDENSQLFYRLDVQKDASLKTIMLQMQEAFKAAHQFRDFDNELFQERFSINELGNPEALSEMAFAVHGVVDKASVENADIGLFYSEDQKWCWNYNGLKTDEEVAKQFAKHFNVVLKALLFENSKEVGTLSLLDEKEQVQLLQAFNQTTVDFPRTSTVVDLFEDIAERFPNNIAVECEQGALTFKELKTKSDQLANDLLDTYRVKPEEKVGIMLERSQWVIVAMLGIQKAGAAYLPIDPEYPEDRVTFLQNDGQCRIVLSEGEDVGRISDDTDSELLDIHVLIGRGKESPINKSDAAGLAYVIYTSGSTGQPKGAMVEHGSLTNHVCWFNKEFAVTEQDSTVLVTSYSFDGSVTYIWSCLTTGATLHILPDHKIKDPTLLLGHFKQAGITFLKLVPSFFSAIVASPTFRNEDWMQTVRFIKLGGEAFPVADARKYHERYPDILLANHYGVTEATIGSICQRIEPEDFERFAELPVMGSPFDNCSIVLLNDQMQLVPVGVQGMMYIGGVGVARGYHNRPDLTTERFVPNPYNESETLYKSGDLAYWTPDGKLVFCGRADTQVKVRGYRVETDEIKHVLKSLAGVQDTVVLARSSKNGETELIAWVVTDEGVSIQALKVELAQQLPVFMHPTYISEIDALPTNQNGKLDLDRLPDPTSMLENEDEIELPSTATEERLLKIWEEVLGHEIKSVTSQFFEHGGNSLKAIRMLAEIYDVFEVEITVRDIFTLLNVQRLAAHIDGLEAGAIAPILPVAIADRYPVSNGQRRLWILNQIEQSSVPYHILMTYELEGDIDIDALQSAVLDVVERHEVLRSTFHRDGEEIFQTVNPTPETALDVVQLEEDEFDKFSHNLYGSEINLETGPLYRLALVQGKNKSRLLVVVHHIVADEWSMQIITGDLLASYTAHARGEQPELQPLALQYKDFSTWQKDRLNSEDGDAMKAFWHQQLAGELSVLNLPSDQARPTAQTFAGAIHTVDFPAELASQLKTYAASKNVSLYTLLVGITKTLLARYSAQDEIIVGTSVSGRIHNDLLNQVGFYVNTVVLRSFIDLEQNFESLLAGMATTIRNAFDNEAYPFDLLVEELLPERDISRNPIFDVSIEYNEATPLEDTKDQSGLSLKPILIEDQVSKFDITFHFSASESGIQLLLEYNTNLFRKERIEAIATHVGILAKNILENDQLPVLQHNYLSVADEEQIFDVLKGQDTDYNIHAPFHTLFSQVAKKTPDAPVLIHRELVLTYKQLDEQSNRLARMLRNAGLQQGDFVGILLPRSKNMLVSMVAIMKAGGAFVPVDLTYPEDRIQYMMDDSNVSIVLLDTEVWNENHTLIEGLKTAPTLVFLDEQENEVNPEWTGQAVHMATSTEPTTMDWVNDDVRARMYMIYTSGSTGQPKGAVLRHDGVLNHVYALLEPIPLSDTYRFLQSAPVSSDISVWQFLAPTVVGGATVIADYETVLDPNALFRCIRDNDVNVAELVPALAQGILNEIDKLDEEQRALPHMQCMIITGEALPPQQVNDWLSFYPLVPVMNAYGPTEASDDILFSLFDQPLDASVSSVTIGKPVANCSIILLDPNLKPVAAGFDGEICITGIGVGEGYWNKPEKTKEVFLENPFARLNGEQMYRTGDIGRWAPNGEMIFLGRRDAQVKIRGNRIELEEIESALRNLNGVNEAIAVVKVLDKEKVIVAYIVEMEDGLADNELRKAVAEVLPTYMVPAYFERLDELPILPNGKIDRRGLTQRKLEIGDLEQRVVAEPTTDTERIVLAIWKEHLKVNVIAVDDNFFALSGHSLQVIAINEKVQRQLHVKLSIKDFFLEPTIRGISILIDNSTKSEFAPIPTIATASDYALSGAQKRFWVLEELQPGAVEYNSVNAVTIKGELNVEAFTKSLVVALANNEVLRTVFIKQEGEPRQQIRDPWEDCLKVHDLTQFPTEEQHTLIVAQLKENEHSVFDFENGPLFNWTLLKLSAHEHVFISSSNHIVTDEWSEKILLEVISEAYIQFVQKGHADAIEPKRIQYKDYAAWHNNLIAEGAFDGDRIFWKEMLSGKLPDFNFTTDFGSNANAKKTGGEFGFNLGKQLSLSVHDTAAKQEVSVYTYLVAAWFGHLANHTYTEDLIMGFPTAGRSHPDLADQLGFYINLLPLRLQPKRNSSFAALLSQAKEGLHGALTHQNYPFDKIASELNLTSQENGGELFKWGFTWEIMRGAFAEDDNSEELLSIDVYEREVSTAHHDFWIYGTVNDFNEIVLNLRFNSALFKQSTMEALAEGFQDFLKQVLESPEEPISDAAVVAQLSQDENHSLNFELDL